MIAPRSLLTRLLDSAEPSIRWKARVGVLREPRGTRRVQALETEVARSVRARRLLSKKRLLSAPGHGGLVYHKWQGSHWVLSRLADIGYPAEDRALEPLRDRVLDFWLRPMFFNEFSVRSHGEVDRRVGVPKMRGRYRRCASQQGNALWSVLRLGLSDPRCDQLAERLLHWQWPDGGWNCDLNAAADTSSFCETLTPMRALGQFAAERRSPSARAAARRASEVFLRRRLFRRVSDGRVIRPEFLRTHYPVYYHYDVLSALQALSEVGKLSDPRCGEALDLLEHKQLPDGGWGCDARYYRVSPTALLSGADYVDWGGTSRRRWNPWVTVEVLSVLSAAGRLRL